MTLVFAALLGAGGCSNSTHILNKASEDTVVKTSDLDGIKAWNYIKQYNTNLVFTRVSFGQALKLRGMPDITS